MNTQKYLPVLQDLVKPYYSTYHRSIKTKPIDVNKTNEHIIWQTLYGPSAIKR